MANLGNRIILYILEIKKGKIIMSERSIFKTEKWVAPASKDKIHCPYVEAHIVEGKSKLMLRIPQLDWENMDIDMSIDCAEAIIDVLTNAIVPARVNKAALEKGHDDDS